MVNETTDLIHLFFPPVMLPANLWPAVVATNLCAQLIKAPGNKFLHGSMTIVIVDCDLSRRKMLPHWLSHVMLLLAAIFFELS